MFGTIEVRAMTDDVADVMGYNPEPYAVIINAGTDLEEEYDSGSKSYCNKVAIALKEEAELHAAGIWTL